MTREANFDGLVGPTHHYAGHSFGNRASLSNAGQLSNPRRAALQGLQKMRALHRAGLIQGVLPPHPRPAIERLRTLGFHGTDADVLDAAARYSPGLLSKMSSASSMWVANAATVSASSDTADARLHFTPANLIANLHRGIEAEQTARILKAVFPAAQHHPPLLPSPALGDEGAANHMRLSNTHGHPGVEVFVWGASSFDPSRPAPTKFPARQTLEASSLIARAHGLGPRALFVQQNPAAIDAGVFHNDVIAVANENVLLAHEDAFVDPERFLHTLAGSIPHFCPVIVPRARVSLDEAVRTYLFNAQLLTLPDQTMWIVAPAECDESTPVRDMLRSIVEDPHNPIEQVTTFDLRESMRNGGGPACLRLRVVLTDEELTQVHAPCLVDDARLDQLEAWVERHYRDRLHAADLRDPSLLDEVRTALDELTVLLELGSLYPFQQN